jgi:hypothetical protein
MSGWPSSEMSNPEGNCSVTCVMYVRVDRNVERQALLSVERFRLSLAGAAESQRLLSAEYASVTQVQQWHWQTVTILTVRCCLWRPWHHDHDPCSVTAYWQPHETLQGPTSQVIDHD